MIEDSRPTPRLREQTDRLSTDRVVLARKLAAEALGTALLIVAVVGSGIMAQRLSPNDVGLQLLENAAATAIALIGLILMFGPVSRAHFNPAVTLSFRFLGQQSNTETGTYICAQTIGGCIGTVLANLMFNLTAINVSTKVRSSGALWLSEVIASVGLLLLIHGIVRSGRSSTVPFAVGAWIGGAYSLINIVREPGRHDRPHPVEHLRRDQTLIDTHVHCHATRWARDRRSAHRIPPPRRPLTAHSERLALN